MQQAIDIRGETPEAMALAAIHAVMDESRVPLVAFSAGKDSSVLLNLVLCAAAERVKQGRKALVCAVHSDVGVESPVISELAHSELKKAKSFADRHGVGFMLRIARPAFWDSFPVRVIGGRALPTFPDTRRDCSSSWKREASAREIASLERELCAQGWQRPVLMTGVRRDESAVRAASIESRREESRTIWIDSEGRPRLSPLLDWVTDDVWMYLGLCNSGVIPSYSDFEATMDTYRAAGASGCVVVADAESLKNSKPCSSRFGCWACTAVRHDRSMHEMIRSDPSRYGFMKPLAALRDFIAYTQYDWNRRTYVGRTIKDGFIEVAADTYSSDMLSDLLKYTLTAQAASGVPIISAAQLLAIDARWSQYAIAPPFSALRIWKQFEAGARWFPPAVKETPKTPVPRLGRIYVGDWNDDITSPLEVTGLRMPSWEQFSESCGPELKTLNNGRAVFDVEGDSEVDEEAAWLFLDFEADRMLQERASPQQYWTTGYETYLSFGVVRPAKGQSSRVDEILRRAQWRQRHGLHGQQDLRVLQQRLTVRYPQQGDFFTAEEQPSLLTA
ncbi:phosphoadenosine phosphosulfate reductase family protein [Piscinibacter gummiphilus]|uniref:Phosphoadenosine phosphosulfate reductase family protein n=1 Tax=Piscinibacter gummiphilus TaxID=946333 RepID=A0ABZ0D1Z7_9BURK|nr:phosphoadenosine phosphosulfate reductase family protein [Piscinibacter gummiphilus]WOB11272.1 phosphoadenosine phosphosulfate reductase family protein [Piscinibacter gummiphilus]